MKTIITAAKLLLVMTLVTGLAYPLLISVIAKIFFADKAAGSPISKNGVVIGSEAYRTAICRIGLFSSAAIGN